MKKEKVLVVSRNILFKKEYWQGLKKENIDYYLNLIQKNYRFLPRFLVENDPSWQQIIPYIVFNFKDRFFLYRYLKKASEKRLQNDYILGIGGHINPEDVGDGKNIIESAAMREWKEEVVYKGKIIEKKIIGILNDDSRPVEAVHLGIIFLFRGDSPKISVKEKETLEGKLVPFGELEKYMKNTKGWAPIVYREYLKKEFSHFL